MQYTIFTKRNRNGIVVSEETAKKIKHFQLIKSNQKIEEEDWYGNSDDVLEIVKGDTLDYRDHKKQENRESTNKELNIYYEQSQKIFWDKKNKLKNRSIEEKARDFSIAKSILKCFEKDWNEETEKFIYNLQKDYFTKNTDKVYYTQNWISGFSKKHNLKMTPYQESFLNIVFTSIGSWNRN